MSGQLQLGCMGWQEKDWVGPLYPEGTKTGEMLAKYSRMFSTVEVDSTFYGRPRETTVQSWHDEVPDNFRFALKVPREVTHRRRFEEVEQVFSLFVQRARQLGPKLGAILIQCPREFTPTSANRTRLFTFLDEQLPPDINVAIELRGEAWYDTALFDAARSLGFALAAAESEHASIDLAERILAAQGDSLGFAYIRWMGTTALEHYDRVQVDKSESLARWAGIIRTLRERVRDVYGYVSDDYAGHSPSTVRDLLERIGD
jgi:uncharacterized protein YecE (DUF72 family)